MSPSPTYIGKSSCFLHGCTVSIISNNEPLDSKYARSHIRVRFPEGQTLYPYADNAILAQNIFGFLEAT